ncbi:hypothetical protein C2845_PM10G12280 [Panicum miliaceum]|uniref:Uncharacterized protein n=1 Tax=Panicum miliaceum TaxID=4540 RepID=A0A3L6PFY1_PANMI|nr:hypothetical protein C2845_PM10G12280 [Panicum miliaceum]
MPQGRITTRWPATMSRNCSRPILQAMRGGKRKESVVSPESKGGDEDGGTTSLRQRFKKLKL